jgi:glycosyltransferase involved in cell wall biosynthesis
VLHLCSDYARQRLYGELVAQLDALGVRQFVYVPVRTAAEIGVNEARAALRASFRYAHVLRPRHRLLFRTKVRTIVADLLAHSDPEAFDVMHAHFLYSDGAVARRLHREYGVPYVVAVRNTDVNAFMRLRPDLRWICWDIVRNARRIVFLTPAYRAALLRRAPDEAREALERRSSVVPNGLDQFWLRDPAPERPAGEPLRLLYVGDFTRNKNIAGSIRAVQLVNGRRAATLTLVGGGGDGEADIEAMLAGPAGSVVRRVGRVEGREALRAIYREHDVFVMPSFLETFGLAYVEALSQGLPVVHTRGQGVDGYFTSQGIAEGVDARDPRSIAAGVLAVASRLPGVRDLCIQEAGAFAWPAVARDYLAIYRAAAAARAGGASP